MVKRRCFDHILAFIDVRFFFNIERHYTYIDGSPPVRAGEADVDMRLARTRD